MQINDLKVFVLDLKIEKGFYNIEIKEKIAVFIYVIESLLCIYM